LEPRQNSLSSTSNNSSSNNSCSSSSSSNTSLRQPVSTYQQCFQHQWQTKFERRRSSRRYWVRGMLLGPLVLTALRFTGWLSEPARLLHP
jgi:hypothetical protein